MLRLLIVDLRLLASASLCLVLTACPKGVTDNGTGDMTGGLADRGIGDGTIQRSGCLGLYQCGLQCPMAVDPPVPCILKNRLAYAG